MRYSREDACRAWLMKAMLPYRELCEILNAENSAEAVYDLFMHDPKSDLFRHLTDKQKNRMRVSGDQKSMHEMLLKMQKHDMGILGLDDPDYPVHLKNISDPPLFLFFIGNPSCLMGRCITMIGSRKASPHGLDATRQIAAELAEHGVAIISGMAMGIDAAAHEGCLNGHGCTAAVLACGLDLNYPAENEALRERILDHDGVLLSEYPPGTPALKGQFPVRNRILSGLSRATLMMECRLPSGTIHTVHHALDQGRDVYAYPGDIQSVYSEGAHQLLREGAVFFTKASDILEDMGWMDDRPINRNEEPKTLPHLSQEQASVLSVIAKGESTYDQIAAETGFDPPTISTALTMLQLYGLIQPMPGKSFIKV